MALTGPQLRVLIAGHRRIEAMETLRAMTAIRAAVWADQDGWRRALADLDPDEADPAAWLEGLDEDDSR
jgi:hypothetical protein